LDILISTCAQGLVWAILALGLYITFRILNFADMTAEGSLALGGASAALLISNGMNPFLSIIIAGAAGSMAGLITGFLHTKLKIPAILSGILTMISLYSINLKIMGKANISLLGKNTVFSIIQKISFLKDQSNFSVLLVGLAICLIVHFLLNIFFKTQIGLAIRATGDNEYMMRAQGANTNLKKILALMISNGICAVSGAFIAQSQGYADINMGTGAVVIALASIVIGEAVIRKDLFSFNLFSVILGSVLYRLIIFMVLNLGMNPSDLKLFTAVTAAILLALPNIKEKIKIKGR
jgi:putative ABC transport system permease protein